MLSGNLIVCFPAKTQSWDSDISVYEGGFPSSKQFCLQVQVQGKGDLKDHEAKLVPYCLHYITKCSRDNARFFFICILTMLIIRKVSGCCSCNRFDQCLQKS